MGRNIGAKRRIQKGAERRWAGHVFFWFVGRANSVPCHDSLPAHSGGARGGLAMARLIEFAVRADSNLKQSAVLDDGSIVWGHFCLCIHKPAWETM